MNYYKETELKIKESIQNELTLVPPYVSKYLLSIQFSTTTRTRKGYLGDIHNFLDYVAEMYDTTAKDVTLEQLDAFDKHSFDEYLNYLSKYEKNGILYTNEIPALRRKLSSLRNFLNYLYIDGQMSSCEILKVKTPKIRKKEIIRLDADEQECLLNEVEYLTNPIREQLGLPNPTRKQQEYHNIQSVRDMAIIYLLLSTGMRVSELVGLNLKDVNMVKFSVRIVRKGEKEDIIYFSDTAKDYLEEYLMQREQVEPIEGHENAFFLSSQRRRISVRSVERLVKKYAQMSVPLKHITPHKLRSTYATDMNEATGGNLMLVKELLGHESVTTTQLYVAQSESQKVQVRNLLSSQE